MSNRRLKRLARLVFELTRRHVWLGGKTEWNSMGEDWPEELDLEGHKPSGGLDPIASRQSRGRRVQTPGVQGRAQQ
jgi:hypothetical protein